MQRMEVLRIPAYADRERVSVQHMKPLHIAAYTDSERE